MTPTGIWNRMTFAEAVIYATTIVGCGGVEVTFVADESRDGGVLVKSRASFGEFRLQREFDDNHDALR